MHRHYPRALRPARFAMALLAVAFCACGPRASSIKGNTEGYDLDHPRVVELPSTLNEISGLWYYAKDTSLFAIEDEDGFLYKIFPNHPERILRWKFGGHGDYEDVIMVEGVFYVLRSDGDIFAVTIASGANIQTVKYKCPEKGSEFEALYWDESQRLIFIVCKECIADDKKAVSMIAFNPATKEFLPAPMKIDAKSIAHMAGKKHIHFKPSAAVINPFTNQLMVLESVNGFLAIVNRDGSVAQAYPLDSKLYKQPEGIAIGTDRTLYISNESANQGAPTLLILPYHAPRK